MKVGDVVSKLKPHCSDSKGKQGVVVEMIPAIHAKQWPRVSVLTEDGVHEVVLQSDRCGQKHEPD